MHGSYWQNWIFTEDTLFLGWQKKTKSTKKNLPIQDADGTSKNPSCGSHGLCYLKVVQITWLSDDIYKLIHLHILLWQAGYGRPRPFKKQGCHRKKHRVVKSPKNQIHLSQNGRDVYSSYCFLPALLPYSCTLVARRVTIMRYGNSKMNMCDAMRGYRSHKHKMAIANRRQKAITTKVNSQ